MRHEDAVKDREIGTLVLLYDRIDAALPLSANPIADHVFKMLLAQVIMTAEDHLRQMHYVTDRDLGAYTYASKGIRKQAMDLGVRKGWFIVWQGRDGAWTKPGRK